MQGQGKDKKDDKSGNQRKIMELDAKELKMKSQSCELAQAN